MYKNHLKRIVSIVAVSALAITGLFAGSVVLNEGKEAKAMNPYLPMWEHIPDGEPYVFEDPDNPGKMRVYVYGSHDVYRTKYCGDDLVVWSAPVEDLTDWRYDGVIFESEVNGSRDTLYAPDIAVKTEDDGSKTYYLYPNNQSGGRNGMIAKSKSPVGPFEVCNWKSGSSTAVDGVLGFDPAVFVDDDGRVYGYWGFQESSMAELDPDTMATIKDGCKELKEADTGINSCNNTNDVFRFFEASSMRKITMNNQTKYVFVYSRMTNNNEFGLGASNDTLAYAYSDNPLGPWTYGGTIVDARGRYENKDGKTTVSYSGGNTHGSIIEINGQWYIFYHRCINEDQHSRQGTAEAITVDITDDGKVVIPEAELTSQGLEVNGLDPYKKYSAGIMCMRSGSSYVKATYLNDNYDPYDYYDTYFDDSVDRDKHAPVVNNKKGNIIGYKYFNFDLLDWKTLNGFDLSYMGKGVNGSIELVLDNPYTGKSIGKIDVRADDPTDALKTAHIDLSSDIKGKHALYLIFDASSSGEIADLYTMQFTGDGVEPTPEPTAVPTATASPSSGNSQSNSRTSTAVQATPAPTQATGSDTVVSVNGFISLFTVKGIQYRVTKAPTMDATVSVVKVKSSKSGITIPATVVSEDNNTYKVTAIEKGAFNNLKKLKKVVVGSNVQVIKNSAFVKCPKLKTIVIKSKKLKKASKKSFKDISKKYTVKVPKSKKADYKKLFGKNVKA